MHTPIVTYKKSEIDKIDNYYSFCTIEIIKSKNANVKYVLEAYKDISTYETDVTFYESSEDKDKTISTILVANLKGYDNGLYVNAITNETLKM